MRQTFDKWTAAIVDRPWLMLTVIVLLTVAAVLGYLSPDSVRRAFLRRMPDESLTTKSSATQGPPANVDPVRLTEADAIVVVQSDNLFSSEGAAALRAIVEEIESLNYVRSVLWLDQVPMLNIFGLPEPVFPRSQASQQRFDLARKKALANPLIHGQLLSTDCKTTLLMVRFDWLLVRSDEQCTTQLRSVAIEAAAAHPAANLSIQITGRTPIFLTAMQSHQLNQWKYQLIGYGMIALMAAILFRGLVAVLVVALAPCAGVFWTLGIMRFFDFQDNPFNDVVLPVMLSLVGLTDGVHLMVQIRRLRASGLSGRDSARVGIREVGLACMLTSLTTAIGFASLYLAHHDIVQEFGICCVIGVVITFVAVITIIPLACSTWLGRWIHLGHEKSLVDSQLDRIVVLIDWVLKRPTGITLAGIAITLVCTAISLTLRPDERNANALPEHSEARLAMNNLDKALGGLESARVEVGWSQAVASDSAEVIEVLSEIESALSREPLIGHPLSIAKLIESLPGEGTAAERASMMELLPPPLKRAFYTPENRQAHVNFRVQDLGIARYDPVFERLADRFSQIQAQHPQFAIELGGNAAWRWKNLYRIVMDLAASLGSAAIVIFLVLGLAYRSVRLGLIAIIPNVFPLAITGTWLVWTGQSLELVSVCAFTVCLGIAVDDTIHFLTRFQEECKRTADIPQAIRSSFTGVGTALIMTTVILVAGFSTVMLSDSRDHRIFSTMSVLTIGTALIGDLVILPAMLAWSDRYWPFREKSKETIDPSKH